MSSRDQKLKVIEEIRQMHFYCYFCPSCGENITQLTSEKFCKHCGQALSWEGAKRNEPRDPNE